MKHISLILLFMTLCMSSYAQRALVSDESKTGSFQATAISNQPTEVSFMLGAAYPDNLLLQLSPRAEMMLNAHIVDSKGVEVQKVEPAKVSGRYANSLDISKLSPGSYFVEVQNTIGDGNNYRIPFSIVHQ